MSDSHNFYHPQLVLDDEKQMYWILINSYFFVILHLKTKISPSKKSTMIIMNKEKLHQLLLCTLLSVQKAEGTCHSEKVVEQDGKMFRVRDAFPHTSPECKQVNDVL